MIMKKRLFAAAASLMFSALSLAHDYQHHDLTIAHPWARATPPGVTVGGGFLTIHNGSDQDETLLGGSAPFAREVQIHETRQEGDVMKMEHRPEGLLIPAGESRSLQPGGYHVMFMGMDSPLVDGEKVPVTLTFEHAGNIDVEFAVEKRSGGMDHDMD
ncbi:copper chaperone PCu(A)C [Saccharospirillum salsuginis]|uniref:Copper chaperone PCu(A)C n=1 Tax=Saccharospirillum salsuginis TaxID=418750 RepID=A0A918KR61_9GAMM|nr:copper chaperone PCu(A)C [Saccharospirillum salsuginis]GGX72827.1 hypothetical protein GCM10007392_45200 [Saccharospirillum salsuginis]